MVLLINTPSSLSLSSLPSLLLLPPNHTPSPVTVTAGYAIFSSSSFPSHFVHEASEPLFGNSGLPLTRTLCCCYQAISVTAAELPSLHCRSDLAPSLLHSPGFVVSELLEVVLGEDKSGEGAKDEGEEDFVPLEGPLKSVIGTGRGQHFAVIVDKGRTSALLQSLALEGRKTSAQEEDAILSSSSVRGGRRHCFNRWRSKHIQKTSSAPEEWRVTVILV
ncbi:hypothetical protein PIB30_078403 [Stylosanthes scabra]|uniref:Uncharacterized protein n=1 Tax=Stylosanthes scabra TaxID=79078 RepID=A0ABU6UT87_9FABA|nr:hypothetical protein [Stylosanthes scabra]